MRLLITANNAFGHVLPLVPVLKEMAGRGHDVLLACPGATADALEIPGVRVTGYRIDPPRPPEPAPDGVDARLAWAVSVSWPNVARVWAGALLDDARAFRPDAVLCEPVEHAGRVVAAALGVPLIEHGWGFTLPAGSARAATTKLADLYASAGATPVSPALRVDLGPDSLQAADAEPGVHRYRYTPWTPPAPPLPPPDGRPRVLLTLGTFPHRDAATRLRRAAEAAAGLDAEVIVVLGNDDRGDPRDLPAGVRPVRWLNLSAEVPRCALVIHHGGAGTSWLALDAGVPAVCLPQAGDQFRNGALLARANAALVVPGERAGGHGLRDVFARALVDPSLAAGAERARRANDALPPVSALADRIAATG